MTADSNHHPAKRGAVDSLPPGPSGSRWWQLARWLLRPLPFLSECRNRYGDPFTVRVPGIPPLVMTSDPASVRAIFADDGDGMHAGEANEVLRPFLGEHSLLLLDGPRHRRERKLLMPPLHGEAMEAHGAAMLTAADRAIDAFPSGGTFALQPWMQRITLEVIMRAVFGVEPEGRFAVLSEHLRKLLDLATWPPMLIKPVQRDLGPWSPWGRFVRLRERGHALLRSLIQERRGQSHEGRTDVLSLLLHARDEHGDALSEDELRDELVTLLVAGHETTATALSWAVSELIENPSVCARLKEELANVPARNEHIDVSALARMPFLDAVVRESLRLHPVVPAVGRVLKRPFELGEYRLRPGAVVVASIYLSSRRADLFPNPERFDPSRFDAKKFGPAEWYPFGGGVRRCIGMAFAIYEMKVVLARLIDRCDFGRASSSPPATVRRSVTLGPSDGVRVRLLARKPAAPAAPSPWGG